MIPDSLDKFIKQCDIKDKAIANYKDYPEEVQAMLNSIYMCCYRFALRKSEITFMFKQIASTLNLNDLPNEYKNYIHLDKIKKQNDFLIKREKKLQRIEQLYSKEPIDLDELYKLVDGK